MTGTASMLLLRYDVHQLCHTLACGCKRVSVLRRIAEPSVYLRSFQVLLGFLDDSNSIVESGTHEAACARPATT